MGMSGCAGPAAAPRPCRCAESPRPKMRMLKKIRKKMGLGRSGCGVESRGVGGAGTSLPPLTFHAVHGDNVRLSRDCSTARRAESFCKGIAFSARPVPINEKVCIRFTEMSTNWSGVLRFGFTARDPSLSAGSSLPKYACPDLTNKPGHWAKALAERLCERGALLQFHLTAAGDVHFSVDGDDKGVFFSGVDTKGPLWVLLDIYGNCTGVQFIDARAQMNNHPSEPVAEPAPALPSPAEEDEVERNLIPALRSATISDSWRPMTFHRTCGRHIRLGPEPGLATRIATEFCQGYIFTARPLAPGERLLVRILETENSYVGALALGLTSCDPSRLSPRDLPDDSDMLLDRPEYWVVSKDVAGTLRVGEELVLTVSGTGEVKVSLNGGASVTVMHVDHSLRLWAFLDVFGGTRRVQVLVRPPPAVLVVALPPSQSASVQSSASSSTASLPLTLAAPLSPPSLANHRNHQVVAHAAHIPRATSANVLTVVPNQPSTQHLQLAVCPQLPVFSSQGLYQPGYGGPNQNAANQLLSQSNLSSPVTNVVNCTTSQPSISTVVQHAPAECTICYEQQIDSVLYTCGHMCMCYRCAVQQWRGKGGGQCPMCRAPIRDVIRTYKS